MANELEPKAELESYSSNNTLFPILGSESESSVTTPRCLFACFSSKDRSTDFGETQNNGCIVSFLQRNYVFGYLCFNRKQ